MKSSNKIKVNKKINPPSEIVRMTYRSLKRRNLFGWFISNCKPLKEPNYTDVATLMRNIREFDIATNVTYKYSKETTSLLHHMFMKLLASLAVTNNGIDTRASNTIMFPFVHDFVENNKASKDVYPCVISYGFYYGTIGAILGMLLIFFLSLFILRVEPFYILMLMSISLTFFKAKNFD